MQKISTLFVCISLCAGMRAQNIAQIKKELQQTPDPIGYVKFKLKKKYFIDTIPVMHTSNFQGLSDSLAYVGKKGQVFGPFPGAKMLVKVLGKAPNNFYHIRHIMLDTPAFTKEFAEKLADTIIQKIKSGRSNFTDMAATYSNDPGSSTKGGDLGWFASGALFPQLNNQLAKRKKGEIFKVWSPSGLHIIYLPDAPKRDAGFALMLRVLL